MMHLFNETKTANGALTYESTGNPLMDINYLLTRNSSDDFIKRILNTNGCKVSTIHYLASILLYRDCREGKGERRIALEMMKARPDITVGLLSHLPSFGRWKDLVDLMDCEELKDECVEILCKQLMTDIANPDDSSLSLVGKWLPSSNAGITARKKSKVIRKALGWRESEYRKQLASLRQRLKVVETMLTKKQHIDISKIPSLSLFKNYSQLVELFPDQFEKLKAGKLRVNANVNQPHEFVKTHLYGEMDGNETIDALWDIYLESHPADLDILPVVDVSGSMEVGEGKNVPIHHALGLGVYCAQNNKGKWKDKLLTFSKQPKCLDIEGHSFTQAVDKIRDWENVGYNTDIESTLKLIADNCSTQDEVPSTLALFSDMEFDEASVSTENPIACGEKYFTEKGLKPPQIIFWNLGDSGRVPVADCGDYIMFNGSSPILLESFMAGEIKTAYEILMNILSSYIMYVIVHI